MIALKAVMIVITIFLLLVNNYKREVDDNTNIINFLFIMYIAIILFG